jgi:16S rRNA (guanine527-N7)-methyltransferase
VSDTATRLRDRARAFGLTVPAHAEAHLVTYFDLLFRWNAKINLTALAPESDAAIDRLLLEPLAAALELGPHSDLIDLGSGGGSPAIPLALVLEPTRLVMVESKSRKAAFLREASRVLGLRAVVEAARFEGVAEGGAFRGQMTTVSIRAVRMERQALLAIASFLSPGGKVALFSRLPEPPADWPAGVLRTVKIAPLPGDTHLVLLEAG